MPRQFGSSVSAAPAPAATPAGRSAAPAPPIVMVPEEMELSGKDYSAVNAVHVHTPDRHRLTAFVPGRRGCINGGADRHYNAVGQRRMGHDMWTAYQEMCADRLAGYGQG